MKTAESKIASSTVQRNAAGSFFKKDKGNFLATTTTERIPFFAGLHSNSTNVIQARLNIGKPNDKYEQEADAMADKVVQRLSLPGIATKKETGVQAKPLASSITPLLQTKCATCEQEDTLQKKEENEEDNLKKLQRKPIFESNAAPPDEETNVQRKCAACEKEEPLQKKSASSTAPTASSNIEHSINASKGSGSPIPTDTKAQMENSFGADFSSVRLHTNTTAVQMNNSLNAQAFTHGNDIYFNAGKYDTNSSGGKHLLAHELTHTVQQGISKNSLQKQDIPPEHLTSLNEMLDRFDVPEEEVISLLRQLTPTEMTTVTTDSSYKNKLANAFNIEEMVRTVVILILTLEKKLAWVEASTSSASNIEYAQIQSLITTPSQAERDVLKTNTWRDFFVSVCNNLTIITAVTDLHFDLLTQLQWIEEEASPSDIEYSQLQPLIVIASQADKDVLKTESWRDFFVGVCNNSTIFTAVTDLHFDLQTQLQWIEDEASPRNIDYAQLQPLIVIASQADKDVLKTESWQDFFVGVCDNATMVNALTDLHFHLKTELEWLMAEGCEYGQFKSIILIASAGDKVVVLVDVILLTTLKGYFSSWDDFAKCIELLGRIIPNAGLLIADATVQADLAAAWTASTAALTCGGGLTTAHEEGGWIYLNLITNGITTKRASAGGQASISLWSPVETNDAVIVGTFHTHPNVGPCWGAPFASPPDITNANNRGVPNIVRGAFPTLLNTSDVFGGPAQRLHLAGSNLFPGTTGGVNPQTSINGEIDFE